MREIYTRRKVKSLFDQIKRGKLSRKVKKMLKSIKRGIYFYGTPRVEYQTSNIRITRYHFYPPLFMDDQFNALLEDNEELYKELSEKYTKLFHFMEDGS